MAELMGSGVELMLVGMGIVFMFLTMLVVAINIMSSLVQRYFPEPPAAKVVVPIVSNVTDKATIAAITAAVHQYRKNKN